VTNGRGTDSGATFPDFNRAFSVGYLRRAMLRALRGHRDDADAAGFVLEAGVRLCDLSRRIGQETWMPSPYRTFRVHDTKPRTVAVIPFADRVVHHALIAAVEPPIDGQLDPDSFACRRGKGIHRCVRRAQELLRRHNFHLGLDVQHYFEELPHDSALRVLADLATPRPFLDLFARVLRAKPEPQPCLALAPVQSGCRSSDASNSAPCPPHSPRGMCIGALTSQFLGNVGLDPVERMIRTRFPGVAHVRYMDDIIVFGNAKNDLWEVRTAIEQCVIGLGLSLKSSSTRLAPSTDGLSFVGQRIFRGTVRPRRPVLVRLGRRIAATDRRAGAGRVTAGKAEASISTRLNFAADWDTLAWRRLLVRRLWPC
jgi:hypothetical protein